MQGCFFFSVVRELCLFVCSFIFSSFAFVGAVSAICRLHSIVFFIGWRVVGTPFFSCLFSSVVLRCLLLRCECVRVSGVFSSDVAL
eukprot:NODE_4211_length_599_cov_123.389091_g100_i2.p1 GENE.NODE_4211_length_599_cov_123.389091_g100_i2~~NODE_4211_length_599_cov_123.389091_g100_i2.p1  ORF type:complete len:86 (+),score=5.79 NODE_4211_length_599_cov_123.389091_g100_i2:304-561(+)